MGRLTEIYCTLIWYHIRSSCELYYKVDTRQRTVQLSCERSEYEVHSSVVSHITESCKITSDMLMPIYTTLSLTQRVEATMAIYVPSPIFLLSAFRALITIIGLVSQCSSVAYWFDIAELSSNTLHCRLYVTGTVGYMWQGLLAIRDRDCRLYVTGTVGYTWQRLSAIRDRDCRLYVTEIVGYGSQSSERSMYVCSIFCPTCWQVYVREPQGVSEGVHNLWQSAGCCHASLQSVHCCQDYLLSIVGLTAHASLHTMIWAQLDARPVRLNEEFCRSMT